MPFKSASQKRKAFATNGFGGKIDPDEWAKKSKKKLPERVKPKKKAKKKRAVVYKDLPYAED